MPSLNSEQGAALLAKLSELGLGQATPEQATDVLNTPATIAPTSRAVPIPIANLVAYAFRIGFVARLNAAMAGDDAQVAVLARSVSDLFSSRLATVDSTDPASWTAFQAMLQTLQAASLLSPQEISAILAMGSESVAGGFGPTPFQSIAGLGDTPIVNPDGSISVGTCHPEYVTEARS